MNFQTFSELAFPTLNLRIISMSMAFSLVMVSSEVVGGQSLAHEYCGGVAGSWTFISQKLLTY
jgi:hypothetical protein